jgi:hypothetical protein
MIGKGLDRVVLGLALAKFTIQIATAGRYGIFRDELYYIACAQHLGWGYVDHPPLIAFAAWISVHLFGLSLFGLRLLPALAGALLVWISASLAQELGGGKFAQRLAAFAIIPVPIYLLLDHWLTMNAFEPILWTLTALVAVRMIKRQEPRLWLPLGLLCGIGMETKYSMILPIAALLIGVLGTANFRLLLNRWFVAGGAIGLVIFLPNLLWLYWHDFPFLEFERASRLSGSQMRREPLDFIADQASILNPVLALLCCIGLVWSLMRRTSGEARFLGLYFLAVFMPLLLLKAKNYYVVPVYPVMIAAGAVAFERWTGAGAKWVRAAYVFALSAVGLALAPLVLPVLPIEGFLAYQRAWNGYTPVVFERIQTGVLPQYFADEFGWTEMVRETARVYHDLPVAEQASTAIFANNYGEAAAIDVLGAQYGLPRSIGNHMSYWLWGPRHYDGGTVIVLGGDGKGERQYFRQVAVAGRVENALSRPEERFDLFLCRQLNGDLRTLWPALKKW